MKEKTISISDVITPTFRKVTQNPHLYEVITDNKEMVRLFKGYVTIIVRIGQETPFAEHTIQPRVLTYDKKNNILPTYSQSREVYKEYKKWLKTRFRKGDVYKRKEVTGG